MGQRGYGIFSICNFLILNLLASIASLIIYDDLFWPPQNVYDDKGEYNDLRQPYNAYRHESRDVSYLPEEVYDDVQPIDEISATDKANERLNRNDRSLLPEYRNLCETVTRKVELKNDPNYEYQPPHYHELFCKSYSLMDDEPQSKPVAPSKQKCAHPSFHCVQRSRTLFMMRRRWDAECWEPITKVIASGCDCMWPVSSLGDVSIHY